MHYVPGPELGPEKRKKTQRSKKKEVEERKGEKGGKPEGHRGRRKRKISGRQMDRAGGGAREKQRI